MRFQFQGVDIFSRITTDVLLMLLGKILIDNTIANFQKKQVHT